MLKIKLENVLISLKQELFSINQDEALFNNVSKM